MNFKNEFKFIYLRKENNNNKKSLGHHGLQIIIKQFTKSPFEIHKK